MARTKKIVKIVFLLLGTPISFEMYLPSIGQDLSQISVDNLEKSKFESENVESEKSKFVTSGLGQSKDVVDAVTTFDADVQVKILSLKFVFFLFIVISIFGCFAVFVMSIIYLDE